MPSESVLPISTGGVRAHPQCGQPIVGKIDQQLVARLPVEIAEGDGGMEAEDEAARQKADQQGHAGDKDARQEQAEAGLLEAGQEAGPGADPDHGDEGRETNVVQDPQGRTRNAQGSIAGSVITMLDAVRLMSQLGFSDPELARMSSLNPARLLGIDQDYGSIEEGKRADLVALDEKLNVQLTMIGGEIALSAA